MPPMPCFLSRQACPVLKKQNHVHDLPKSKIVSTTYRKAKVVPQPLENQSLDKFPRTEKGISTAPERDDPGPQKSLYFRLFQPSLMYFLSSKLQSQRVTSQRNYWIIPLAGRGKHVHRLLPVRKNAVRNISTVFLFVRNMSISWKLYSKKYNHQQIRNQMSKSMSNHCIANSVFSIQPAKAKSQSAVE